MIQFKTFHLAHPKAIDYYTSVWSEEAPTPGMLRVLGLGSIRDHLQQANVHHRFAQVIVWSWSLPTSHAALLDPNLKARPQGLFTHTTHPQILISTD
jgi:hypothetical protein